MTRRVPSLLSLYHLGGVPRISKTNLYRKYKVPMRFSIVVRIVGTPSYVLRGCLLVVYKIMLVRVKSRVEIYQLPKVNTTSKNEIQVPDKMTVV